MNINRGDIWYIGNGYPAVGSEQISTVSVERLGNYCGHVSDSELTAIENAMLISLGIQLAPVSEESEETPPMPESRLAEVEARCRVLQELYDALLDRFVKAG